MTPLESLIASNFVETNRRLDDVLSALTQLNEGLKRLNEEFASME